jgi:nitroimidazol reductase NimA-like FMN-containing flavoprotein (pyridoxamine 5'-phosphate oxidase superfamily)
MSKHAKTHATQRRVHPASEMLDLSQTECLRLIAAHQFGRIAVDAVEGPPIIRPVNYRFEDRSDTIIFRIVAGSTFDALLRCNEAAFEIDGTDDYCRTGWSVVVQGTADEVTDPDRVRRLDSMRLAPWAPGQQLHWMRIELDTVSGRRVLLPEAMMPGYYLG